MKILFITSSLNPNDGWGRYSNNLVKEIAKYNDVFVLSHILCEVEGIDQQAVLHSPLSVANPFKIFISSRKIQRIINSFKPDMVHFLVEPYVEVLPFLNVQKKIKTILTVHGTYSFLPFMFLEEKLKSWIVGYLVYKAYKKVDGIIAVSSFTKAHLLEKYRDFYREDFLEDKIEVISNGVDLSKFSLDYERPKNNQKKLILFVGSIKRRKGILEALEALGQYRDDYNDNFIYRIVGLNNEEDSYFKIVKSKIAELQLQDQVLFTGFVSEKNLEDFYKEADLFLLLSIQDGSSFEGFGLVYLEANLYGVPTIGTRDSGAREAISDSISGYLVNPFDPTEVAEKINSVLNEESIKSEDCVAWAKKQDIKEKAKLVLSLYKNI